MTTERLAIATELAVSALALAALAVAAWLIPASVHVVGWAGDEARRVVLLASWKTLVVWIAAAFAVFAVGVVPRRRSQATRFARLLAPLTLLGLWTVPYLPWVSDRFPLTVVIAGPLRWIVAAVALAKVAVTLRPRWLVRVPLRRVGFGSWGVFVVSLLLFTVAAVHVKRVVGVVGDEPHYLVMTHSVVADGDLRIENNHVAGDYRAFHAGFLPMHFLTRGVDDVVYSVHAPGLALLLAPVYALGGHRAAIAFLIVLAAATATLVFRLAERLTNRGAALVTWAAVTLTVPFFLQSWMVFPEMPAAGIAACEMVWLWTPGTARDRAWLGRGAVLGMLPWLHVKYSFLLAGLAASLIIKAWGRWRTVAAMVGPLAVSGGLWLATFFVMYGRPDPTAPYGRAPRELALANVPRGILGLLFDQEFGLLLCSPVYVLVCVGAWVVCRDERTRGPALGTLATLAAFLVSVAIYYMWWGGYSVPARFLVPVLPLMAPLLASAVGRVSTAGAVGVVGTLLVWSVGTLVSLLADPARRLMFNDRDGSSRLVEMWQGGIELTATLPSFIDPDWLGQVPRVAVWTASALVATGIVWLVGRSDRCRLRPFGAGVLWLLAAGVAASLAMGSLDRGEYRASTARGGQLALLHAFDGERLAAYDAHDWTRLVGDRLFDRAVRDWPVADPPAAARGAIAGPFVLPPGRYDVVVWLRSDARPRGNVWLRYHTGPPTFATARVEPGEPHATMSVVTPVELDTVWVGSSSADVARAVSGVTIRPRDVVPRHDRLGPYDVTAVRPVGDRAGALAFFLDGATHQESDRWWVRGDETTSLLVSPGGARGLSVLVRRGAAGGITTVRVGGMVDRGMVGPRQTREVRAELTGTEAAVPVTVGCEGGFRPVDVDPNSTDGRYLGCVGRIRLF